MKADRLLSLVLLLQAHGRMTGREMAKRLEVSERTVHRDMEALSAAGVPVLAVRGSAGGWQLDEGWRTRVPGLDEEELRALIMAQPKLTGNARLASAAERALVKLMAALPDSMREKASSIRQRLYVDATEWRGTTEDLSLLPIVQDALSRDRKLAIRYRRVNGEQVERVVDPLGLVAKGSVWYLFAGTPHGIRTYRVSRIDEASLLEIRSVRPANFDLAASWDASLAEFQKQRRGYWMTLRVDPTVAERLKMWGAQEIPGTGDDGWITLRLECDHANQACFVVLGLGARVDVIEPESLREQAAMELARAVERLRQRGWRFRATRASDPSEGVPA